MLKTSKLISLLLVVAMILSVFSVGVVATGAADAVVAANVVYDGATVAAHVGDTFHYEAYMNVRSIPACAEDGKVNVVDGILYYDKTKLQLVGDPEFPNFNDTVWGDEEPEALYYNDQNIGSGFNFGSDDSVLISADFKIIAEGDASITSEVWTLGKGTQKIISRGQPLVADEVPTLTSSYSLVDCPHTVEEPTEAPFDPETQLAVTLVGFDGERETKIFNIGEKFTVYGYLCTKEIDNGKLAALDCEEDYDVSKVKLLDEWDPDDDGMFYDLEKVYPVTGDDTISNAAKTGRIIFNASKARGFNFKNADSQLIVTDYEAVAPGETTIELKVKILARVGAEVEKIVNKYVVKPGFRFVQHLTFDPEYQAPDLPAPTEAATETETESPVVPTEAPTATVKIYDFNGNLCDTKTFNVGDSFDVYTTLNAYNTPAKGKIASIKADQTYTKDVLALASPLDADQMLDEDAFPIFGGSAMGRLIEEGRILYNASTPSIENAFKFNTDDDVVIVTKYTVTAGGDAEVHNALITLGAADEYLTRMVKNGVAEDGVVLSSVASFAQPEAQEDPVEPTEAPAEPTEAPAPADTYVVAGKPASILGVEWNPTAETNAMTFANDVWSKEYTVSEAVNDVQLKAVKNGETWIGDETGNNVTFNLTGAGTFTVYCDGTKTWVEGDIVDFPSGLDVKSVTLVGNGSPDGDNWLNNIEWNPAAEANHMTEVSDGVYEIEFTLGEYDTSDPEFKFAINDAWTHNFGLGDNGVFENGVETDAIYNGSQNLKIMSLAEGTKIKAQLDLSGFDFNTKTGAKMTITWTAPTEPTEAPAEPTEAPVVPTEAPAEPTEAPGNEAIVTIYGLDGESETKTFQVGETFAVYTTLNTSEIEGGKIASMSGTQTYTDSILTLADEYSDVDGAIVDLDAMFPITKDATVANGKGAGIIRYNASTPSIQNAFSFDSDNSLLIVTHYTVSAPGTAEVRNAMRTLAVADENLTPIIYKSEVKSDNFRMHAQYDAPVQPTEAPAEPTDAPVEPTTAPVEPTTAPAEPTTAPVEPTTAPVEPTDAPLTQATVHIFDIYGQETDVETYDIGQTFTVYTLLNAKDIQDGKIAALSGTQTYDPAILTLADAVENGEIKNLAEVFPITGEKSLGNAETPGTIIFNASTPSIENPFLFNRDDSVLIKTQYTVTKGGDTEIHTTLKTLASADEDLTRIIVRGDVVDNNFTESMVFELPEVPTEAPAEPTTAPVEPTEAPAEPTDAPVEPTTAPVEPTTAPVEPTTAPVEPTDAPLTQATVHIFDIYGQETDVETYDIGQTFTVYTLLNAKDIQDGKIAALSGTQTYDPAILTLADAVENGEFKNLAEVFPITGEKSLGNAETPGTIIFNASTPSIENPFLFNRDDSVLIKTQYTVTKGGDTEIHTTLKTLASADEDLTRIISKGEVADNNFTESMVFELPEVPTEAPAEPTTAPVEPTTAPVEPTTAPVEPTTAPVEPTTAPVEPTTAPVEPTTAPVEPTTAPVEPTDAQKATITIYSLDGSSETKEFNVGDTFTVYTTLNVKESAPDGIASINASQTYSNDILALDKTASAETMFPILKDSALVNLDQDGKVLYNASTPKIENAFRFNSNDDLLIVTTYTVTAPGTGEVRNAIKTMAAADDMLTPIVKRGEIQPDKGLSQITSFDAPIPEPTDAPVEPTTAPVEPTTAPVEPTTAPVEPTTAPVEPTTAPVEPTTAPVEPTTAPVEPTTAPVEPTTAPVEPTTAPVEPTTAPVEPTTAPVEPTTAPVEPTTAPVEPTTAPVEPTTAPVEPTTAPSGDTVFINADGNIYEVAIGSEHVYTFYLNNGGKVCGVDASTTWDAPVLSMVGDPSFPNLDDSLVVNNYVDLVDEEGNLVEQVVYFNYTNADGADFDNDDAKLITFTVKVADDATPGETYYITTNIKTLEGEDEEKQIFEDTDITPEKITRREGVLDDKAPDKKAENKYTVNDETYVKGSNESKLFTVNGEVDDERTFGKFRALYIDGALVDYSNYTKESGSLKLTLLPAYMETLEVGEHEMKYVFSDGEAIGKLTVVEGEKPTTGPTVAPTTAPTSKVTPTSGTNGSGTSTNGSAVKTGSPEMAIIFMIILVMAAGIIVFTKKRRED